MNGKCEIIKDLLPLYADDVCSDESRKAVEEHIESCPDCKEELEKLRKNVSVSPQKDADVFKRIKRRLRIEKLVVGIISALALCGALCHGLIYLVNTDSSMDIEKYKILDNVSVTEHDGVLWLNIKGEAASFVSIHYTFSDTNGNYLGFDNAFDKDKKDGYGVTLKQRKIDSFEIHPRSTSKCFEQKLFDISKKKDIVKLFYYDDINDKEYVLWERDEK